MNALELDKILALAENPKTSRHALEVLVSGLLRAEKPGMAEHWILVALTRNSAVTGDMRIRLYGRYYNDPVFGCLIPEQFKEQAA